MFAQLAILLNNQTFINEGRCAGQMMSCVSDVHFFYFIKIVMLVTDSQVWVTE